MKIDVNAMARRVEVDIRIPLRYYYRIADSLLKQAEIYREEKNIVDLYIILLRYSSLVSETIPYHRDYQVLLPKEKAVSRKRLLAVLDELESLKPDVQRRVEELNKTRSGARLVDLDDQEGSFYGSATMSSLDWTPVNKGSNMSLDIKQPASVAVQPSWKYNSNHNQIDWQFQKLSLNIPLPNKETLSRHSFLGPNGLRGQWLGPNAEIKVQYPSHKDLASAENSGLNQAVQHGPLVVKDGEPGGVGSAIDSVLSLDDGLWLHPAEEACPSLTIEATEDPFKFVGMKQPSPPPVLAQVLPQFTPIHPSKVADPRPGPAKSSQDGLPNSSSYQHLHVPVQMMEDFLRLARANTEKNLETCGVLAGSLRNRVFHITTLIIPKQESTSDSCSTLNEEEIFEIMLPEAIAIVMAPTDTASPHGIFHLSDPGGVTIIRNCQQRGFHPHEEPSDGTPIYEHCSHVFMNPKIKFDVVDLR
ncbi:AMSH-like ubiquitin thioesterase 3 [Hibiscus syriacus]|uniref:AMSH-like ubiquitin thioesterase 3 n=1 Tax=Hibiscus syriacus TaxID=106335 RepID=A0A6A3BPL2_HIBSY|nr:AMSH-like ubiquitin thioesterase 3 [Hibiscus syriacus]